MIEDVDLLALCHVWKSCEMSNSRVSFLASYISRECVYKSNPSSCVMICVVSLFSDSFQLAKGTAWSAYLLCHVAILPCNQPMIE